MNMIYNMKNLTLKYKKEFVTHQDIAKVYDDLSKTHSSILSSGFLGDFKRADSILKLKKGAKILDIGCGDGILSEIFPEHCSYLGIDLSKRMIDKASKHYKNVGNRVFFEKTNAINFLSYSEPQSYDLIIFSFSWKYFDNNFFKKILQLLKNDGKLLILNELEGNNDQLIKNYNEFRKENHKKLVKIFPYTYAPKNIDEFETILSQIGFKQTIFFPLKKNFPFSGEYLIASGIIPELSLEFGNENSFEYQKKFIEFLKNKKYYLPLQNFFICIAKK